MYFIRCRARFLSRRSSPARRLLLPSLCGKGVKDVRATTTVPLSFTRAPLISDVYYVRRRIGRGRQTIALQSSPLTLYDVPSSRPPRRRGDVTPRVFCSYLPYPRPRDPYARCESKPKPSTALNPKCKTVPRKLPFNVPRERA